MPRSRIKFDLSSKASMQRAIDRVNKLIVTEKELQNEMVRKTTEKLVNKMKENASRMLGVSWAGESIRATYSTYGKGYLTGHIWGADYIIYIEYGTGQVGAANAKGNAPAGWRYNDESWVYYDERVGFVTTEGQAPRPFIRESIEQINATLKADVSVVVGEWIAST